MNEVPILDLDPAVSIDPATDFFPIANTNLDDTFKINRNVFLGITGSPVGTTDTQALSNKTIGITNTVILADNLFTLQDNADNTKQAQFQLSGITTATTRTYTLPNASSTLADIATAQTFTNKTLTSPVITGGTITGSTIAVDSIAGNSSATVVTVAGLQISAGVLNTSNSVVNSNITNSAVTPEKLLTGTGTSWPWSSWTPSWTNVTVGNGTVSAFYRQTGKTVTGTISLVLGSTSAVTGAIVFSLPVTAQSRYNGTTSGRPLIGTCYLEDAGVVGDLGMIQIVSTTTGGIVAVGSAATWANTTSANATTPFTWGNGDFFTGTFTYEAA